MEGEDSFKGSVRCTWFHGWTLKAPRSVCCPARWIWAGQPRAPHSRDISVLIRSIFHVPSQTGKAKCRKQFLPHSNYKSCWEWEAGGEGRTLGEEGPSPSRQGLGDNEVLQRLNLRHYFLCFAQISLGRSLWWWMRAKTFLLQRSR